MSSNEWIALRPCPSCGHANQTGFCTQSLTTGFIACRSSTGAARELPDGRFLHIPDGNRLKHFDAYRGRIVVLSNGGSRADLTDIAKHYEKAAWPAMLDGLADRLDVSTESLRRLQAGWCFDRIDRRGKSSPAMFDAGMAAQLCDNRTWSFPMRDAYLRVNGIRLRCENGEKFSIAGGHEGLFIPTDLHVDGPLLVCEGLTDCLAMLTLGFAAIGRPSCTGGKELISEFVRTRSIKRVVIFSDSDSRGLFGANRLADSLRLQIDAVGIVSPPEGIKDARAWKIAGANRADVESAINAANLRNISLDIDEQVRGVVDDTEVLCLT